MKSEDIPAKTIAIDGPAASGKSSVGRMIARHMGYSFLDTGIMYRAVTFEVINQGVHIKQEAEIGEIAENTNINVRRASNSDGCDLDIYINAKNVTDQLRTPAVNDLVSQVSRYRAVRDAMTRKQRIIGGKGGIVMAGRDIGTVVLPNADLKFFLKASIGERARRRYGEEKNKGSNISYKEVYINVAMRDKIDSTRAIAPLKPAADAHIIHTDGKNVDTVIAEILRIVEE